MIRTALLTLTILLAIMGNVYGADDPYYTLEDGDTIDRGHGAFLMYGGYPLAGLEYVAAPWDYITVGFRLDVRYLEPSFAIGAPFKFQILESDKEDLNFALTIYPGADFNFSSDKADVVFFVNPGFAAGWRFYGGNTFFINGSYMLGISISPEGDIDGDPTTDDSRDLFRHHPIIGAGFEIPLGPSIVNMIFKGTVEFFDYDPDEFVYGGYLGLAFALWR